MVVAKATVAPQPAAHLGLSFISRRGHREGAEGDLGCEACAWPRRGDLGCKACHARTIGGRGRPSDDRRGAGGI